MPPTSAPSRTSASGIWMHCRACSCRCCSCAGGLGSSSSGTWRWTARRSKPMPPSKAMSYARLQQREAELQAEVDRWLAAAEAADAEEDKLYGRDKRGEEMPDWIADKEKRLEKIREAKAALEAEAKAAAAAKAKAAREAEAKRRAQGRRKPGKPAAPPRAEPEAKAQRNLTDPDSASLQSKKGCHKGYKNEASAHARRQ